METNRIVLENEILAPALRLLNDLVAGGLLRTYAIGGGVGVLYYIEPVLTYDFDVICLFPGDSLIINPEPLFSELKKRGFTFAEEDRIAVNGVLVQFIPAEPGLMEEALEKSVEVEIEQVPTRILKLEYLMANMLRIFRAKDRAKLSLIVESHQKIYNADLLHDILKRYNLLEKWQNEYNA